MSGGRGAFIDPNQPLAAADYLVATTLDGARREARIFLGAALEIDTLMKQFESRLQWVEQVDWDNGRKAVRAERHLKLGALCLRSESLPDMASDACEAALMKGIRQAGLECLPWTRALRTWQARVMFLHRLLGDREDWPDVSDARLTDTLAAWLGPFIPGIVRLKDLKKVSCVKDGVIWLTSDLKVFGLIFSSDKLHRQEPI